MTKEDSQIGRPIMVTINLELLTLHSETLFAVYYTRRRPNTRGEREP